MRLIFRYIKKHIGIFLLSTLFLTMEAVADLLQPTVMSHIVDDGVETLNVSLILQYGGIMLLIAFIGAVSAVMRNNFASRTSQTTGKEIRKDMYHQVQQLSLANIDHLQPATIITRMTNDVTQVQEFINRSMRMMVKAPITCVGAILLIVIQTPKQAPIMLGIIIVVSLLIIGNMKFAYPRFGRVQQSLDKLNSTTREFLRSIRVVKAFGAENDEQEKFNYASSELATANVSAMRTLAVFSPMIQLTVNLGIIVLLWLSKGQRSEDIGKLMASVNYMTQVLFAVNMLSGIMDTAVRATASAARINEVLSEQPSQIHTPTSFIPSNSCGELVFENVSFRYSKNGKEALNNISFKVCPGETIGIIGPTGSGKTTLVNLVPRLYDASEGRITIDGQDVTQVDEVSLRKHISLVAQKALLFSGTIEDNIRWGCESATLDEIHIAAEIACANQFIEATSNGYQTILGQGGVNLSGGQKQRISLARALVRNPKILILDDCTSALDAQTESRVLEGLRQNSKGMTVLLISQRIATVKRADKILCIDNGTLQGYGTHDELMQHCGTYQAIYESQIGGVKNG